MDLRLGLADDGEVRLESVSGDLLLTLPRDLSAQVSGETFRAILRGLRPRYEQHHEMLITDDALEAAVRLSAL